MVTSTRSPGTISVSISFHPSMSMPSWNSAGWTLRPGKRGMREESKLFPSRVQPV